MKIALVFNPFTYKKHEENLRVVQKYFGLFPPLSLAWVAGIIRKAGHDVIIIDARTLSLSLQQTAGILKKYRPDIIGAMMTTYMFPETLSWVKYLKNELHASGIKVRTLIGGYNLRIYPLESMTDPAIDFGCEEHAYFTVPALLEALEAGRGDLSGVPGLLWRDKTGLRRNPHPQKIDFNAFPFPARDLLPNELYAEFPTQRKNFTVMVTSLGCPHTCMFCEAGDTKYSPRDAVKVVDEMQECHDKYGVNEIDIFDYDFTADKARAAAICREIGSRGLKMTWACRSRVDNLDDAALKNMYSAGCRRIYWGIEHGDQKVLDGLNKKVSLERAAAVMKSSRAAGIQNLGFFLVGVPGETRESARATVSFAKSLDLDYAQFSKLLAKPGTPLLANMKKNGWRDYWADWVSGTETDRDLPRPWLDGISGEELGDMAKKAYLGFYARPAFLVRHLLRCRSPFEILRKFFALMDMLCQSPAAGAGKKFRAYSENIILVMREKTAWLRRS